jgi:hypothetical protein
MDNLKRDLTSKVNMHLLRNRISKNEALVKYGITNNHYCSLMRESASSLRELDLKIWWNEIKNENNLL